MAYKSSIPKLAFEAVTDSPSPSLQAGDAVHLVDKIGKKTRHGTGEGTSRVKDSGSQLDLVAAIPHREDEARSRKKARLQLENITVVSAPIGGDRSCLETEGVAHGQLNKPRR